MTKGQVYAVVLIILVIVLLFVCVPHTGGFP